VSRERDEPVRLTRIYTRGGDAGETSLGDGSRVSKRDARIAAFGTVDELNAALGVVLAGECPEELRDVLGRVQNELFDLGADLSVPYEEGDAKLRVTQAQIDALERSVREERQQFDVLRAQRAELRSPARLADAASALGMSPGLESQFISVDPMVLAITIARTGEVPAGEDDLAGDARLRPLDQFRIVKSLNAEAP